jgi:hypothetical protein
MSFENTIFLFEKHAPDCGGIESGNAAAIYNDFLNMG